jgi:hypothetical protein
MREGRKKRERERGREREREGEGERERGQTDGRPKRGGQRGGEQGGRREGPYRQPLHDAVGTITWACDWEREDESGLDAVGPAVLCDAISVTWLDANGAVGPAAFGQNLQCQPVRIVNARGMPLAHACKSFKRSKGVNSMASSSVISCRKPSTVPIRDDGQRDKVVRSGAEDQPGFYVITNGIGSLQCEG